MKKRYTVGIDLGTSTCSLGFLAGERVYLLKVATDGEPLVPAAVYFAPGGGVLVGHAALDAAAAEGGDLARLVAGPRRLLGDLAKRWKIDGREYTPTDVAAVLLRHLRVTFEQRVGDIDRAVLCVPASYDAAQRDQLREAGRLAGLPAPDLALVDEPVAAALSQILGGRGIGSLPQAAEQLLIYDLGGGAFDVSLVRYEARRFSVQARDGRADLGGSDWNHKLEDHVVNRMAFEHAVDLRAQPRLMRELEAWAERAKRSFSDPLIPSAAFEVDPRGRRARVEVSRREFEAVTADLAEHTRLLSQRLIGKSQLFNQINRIVGVGGGTHLPAIRTILNDIACFAGNSGHERHRDSPQQAVVEGAVLFSHLVERSPRPAALQRQAAPVLPVEVAALAPARLEEDLESLPEAEVEFLPEAEPVRRTAGGMGPPEWEPIIDLGEEGPSPDTKVKIDPPADADTTDVTLSLLPAPAPVPPAGWIEVVAEELIEGEEFDSGVEVTPAPAAPPSATITRLTDVTFPAPAAAGVACPLRVLLTPSSARLPNGEPLRLPPPHPHDVRLTLAAPPGPGPIRVRVRVTAENFAIDGDAETDLIVPPAGDSPPVTFRLRAGPAAPRRIILDFSQDGRHVGSVYLHA